MVYAFASSKAITTWVTRSKYPQAIAAAIEVKRRVVVLKGRTAHLEQIDFTEYSDEKVGVFSCDLTFRHNSLDFVEVHYS